jgi:hypothetical protein
MTPEKSVAIHFVQTGGHSNSFNSAKPSRDLTCVNWMRLPAANRQSFRVWPLAAAGLRLDFSQIQFSLKRTVNAKRHIALGSAACVFKMRRIAQLRQFAHAG